MKRIICVTESLAGGGAEHQMSILANFLFENGYDVTLVTFANAKDFYPLNKGIKRVMLGINGGHVRQSLEIVRYFLLVKADCVISYRQCSNARISIPLLFRKNVRLISSERNTTIGQPDKFEKLLINWKLYKRSDYVVPNSISQAQYIKHKRPEWEQKIVTIINYTDLEQFPKSSFPNDLTTIKIAVFARYSAQKNPIRFIEMCAKLKKETDKHFMVHWYGQQTGNISGYNSDYLKCKDTIAKYCVEDVIELKQAVSNPALIMEQYHAICLPSLFEGFSNSIAEAICSGKVVLCGDVSDNGLMVHNGENGYLFDPTNIDSMISAFKQFFSLSIPEIESKGTNSRIIAEELFNKERFINSYIHLIES